MPKRDGADHADRDDLSGRKAELRAARGESDEPSTHGDADRPTPSDDAEVASEPMVLERIPAAPPPRVGRQRTGDPPRA